MPPEQERALYERGIAQFNQQDFFEAHETWEDAWNGTSGRRREFYQGLIQAAVALYHFGNGNVRGARKLHGSVHGYLDPYLPRYLGLDLEKFLREFDRCLAEVVASTDDRPVAELDPDLLPEIHLDPPPDAPAA